MKLAQFILCPVILVLMAFAAADAAPARKRPVTQAVPKDRDALYRYCGAEAFRKFGWNHGSKGRVLYVDFLYEQQELCVRNGGRL